MLGLLVCREHLENNPSYLFLTLPCTDPDGAVGKSSANELVCTGFTSWYQLQDRKTNE